MSLYEDYASDYAYERDYDRDIPDFSLCDDEEDLAKLLRQWKCVEGSYAWNLAVSAYRLAKGD